MSGSVHTIRMFVILLGLAIIPTIIGGAAWGQAPAVSPAVQQLLDRVKDAEARKDWREMQRIGDEVIARDPKAWGGWYWKGIGQINLEELGEAAKSFKESVTVNPSFASGWHNLGWAYTKLGDHTKAAEAYEKAVSINPKLTVSWLNLWGTYNAIGNRDKVREAYQKLKDLDPEKTKQAIAKYGVPEDPSPSIVTSSTEVVETGDSAAIRDALSKLASAEALITQEKTSEALPLLEAAFKVLTANLGAGSEEALRARDYLLFVYADLYRLGDSMSLTGPRNYRNSVVRIRQIHQRRLAAHGERSEKAIRSATGLAYTRVCCSKPDQARISPQQRTSSSGFLGSIRNVWILTGLANSCDGRFMDNSRHRVCQCQQAAISLKHSFRN